MEVRVEVRRALPIKDTVAEARGMEGGKGWKRKDLTSMEQG